MDRFVVCFRGGRGKPEIDDQINKYALNNNLKILNIIPVHRSIIYVLFEKGELNNACK